MMQESPSAPGWGGGTGSRVFRSVAQEILRHYRDTWIVTLPPFSVRRGSSRWHSGNRPLAPPSSPPLRSARQSCVSRLPRAAPTTKWRPPLAGPRDANLSPRHDERPLKLGDGVPRPARDRQGLLQPPTILSNACFDIIRPSLSRILDRCGDRTLRASRRQKGPLDRRAVFDLS